MKHRLLILAAACLLALLGAGLAATTSAHATFADAPCYPSGAINTCPDATVGAAYDVQLLGRDGTGCWPYDTFHLMNGYVMPPGLSVSSSGLISGTPTSAGTWLFYVEMTDYQGPADQWCTTIKSYQRELQITVNAAPATTTAPTTTIAPLPYYWHLTAGTTLLHSELAVTYPDGTTGLGDMLRWEQAHKDAIRGYGDVRLARVKASS